MHAPVAIGDTTRRLLFSFPLSLNGSLRADVVTFPRTTTVALAGDYPHPSFLGKWLPTERAVVADSFIAR
jgi:inner membrane protein